MIPSLLDKQIRQGVSDFVRTTFSITTPSLRHLVDELCDTPERMFKGPWISLGLPFLQGRRSAREHFPELAIPHAPFRHQEIAWERLKDYRSTLVATGTGSGKTECFLYPVLDHVRSRKRNGHRGIQAIFVYPMNALASDQARRIAKAIAQDPALAGLRAGLFVGDKPKEPQQSMGPETVITDKATLRVDPPDILLTNYKMLDYLLTRPKDRDLWKHNRPGAEGSPSTLRYLVVDELHTFDGAQGTDLALLVRRLKERLGCRGGDLCCVGTSATLGGAESREPMREYARRIFGEVFDDDALVTEQRQDADDFLGKKFDFRGVSIPGWGERERLDFHRYQRPEDYLKAQSILWFPERDPDATDLVDLGERLKRHAAFRALVKIAAADVLTQEQLILEMGNRLSEFDAKETARATGADAGSIATFLEALLASLISLAAWARTGSMESPRPFVQSIRVQSWIRELRRMVATLEPSTSESGPQLCFSDDMSASLPERATKALPLVYCRECGNAGWVGLVASQVDSHLRTDAGALQTLYGSFFGDKPSPNLRFLFPDLKGKALLRANQDASEQAVCTSCLKMHHAGFAGPCSCGNDRFVQVLVPDCQVKDSHNHSYTLKACPGCGSRQSLVLLGAQAASLAGALINQLFSSRFNPDKKLIAFSDNVQDASHRAAFFGARTWKFNLRGAVQQMLESTPGTHDLQGLGARVVEHWRAVKHDDSDAACLFAPPDVLWMDELRQLQDGKSKVLSDAFWKGLCGRIEWEVLTEYGLDCRKGRTLEKAGSSIAAVDLAWDGDWIPRLAQRLQDNVPDLRGQELSGSLPSFLGGMVRRWIHNGAIGHGALDGYVESLGNPFLIHKSSSWMRAFGKSSRTPQFPWKPIPGEDKRGRLDPIDSRTDKPTSWYAHWLIKHWGGEVPHVLNHYEAVLGACLEALEEQGILERREVKPNARATQVWMLRPERLKIHREVVGMACRTCGHQIALPRVESESFGATHCFRTSCTGTYAPMPHRGDFYGDLYAHGDLVRLVPQEHTSLLGREEREDVEARFKATKDRNAWDPNLLSCTPTLEMGIDIGDLSSVLLCSMPPKQAAFLQRIGRAGRTDGNAVVQTIAEGNPHDLYFWADPPEMLKGRVDPPGVFLDATAILERQIIAFGLDCWVARTDGLKLPARLRNMLDGWQAKQKNVFPSNFLGYMEANHADILARFVALLENEIGDDTKRHLEGFMDPRRSEQSLRWRFLQCLELAVATRRSLMDRRKELDAELASRRDDPQVTKDLVEELEMERSALARLILRMEAKDCYQFLTDEGLIPNYAFPEAGVQLKSVIYRRPPAVGTQVKGPRNFKDVYEYERAAAAAINDFAPGNYFYAHGRKVRIDQVDQTMTKAENWRLCPQCGHMELGGTTSGQGACPMCQSPEFAAFQQVQSLLRIRQVYATTSDRASRVGDDSDNRDVKFFEKAMQVGLQGSQLLGAWELDDRKFPFGYEVRTHVALREINFGQILASGSSVGLKVGGKEIRANGFSVCRTCGKVQLDGKIEHTFQCKQKHLDDDQEIQNNAFLYREYVGEALRLFVPTLAEGETAELRSFLAAFHLGLKLHYKGDVSHLQGTLQTEPIPGNDAVRKPFLVIYDSVPGGTGYLKQFVQDETLLRTVLRKAYDRMLACDCQYEPGKDGCYRCLLAHRNAREMKSLSRKTAMELLKLVIDPKRGFKSSSGKGLSGIVLTHTLESELEKKFVQSLSLLASHRKDIQFETRALEFKSSYRLKIHGVEWDVVPQETFGPLDGLTGNTRPDFVLRRVGGTTDDKLVLLYLDGWEYHYNRLHIDTKQRMDIHRRGWLFWTLTWDDFRDVLNPTTRSGGLLERSSEKIFEEILLASGSGAGCDIPVLDKFSMLLRYLKSPDDALWRKVAEAVVALNVTGNGADDGQAWAVRMRERLPASHPGWGSFWTGLECGRVRDGASWSGRIKPAKDRSLEEAVVIWMLHDANGFGEDRKNVWEDAWRAANLLQFLREVYFVSESGIEAGSYDGLDWKRRADAAPALSEEYSQIAETLAAGGTILHSLLARLCAEGLEAPEPVYEIYEDDVNVGNPLLAWPSTRVGIVKEAYERGELEAIGWKPFLLAEFDKPETWARFLEVVR